MSDIWAWMKTDEVTGFYQAHREHAKGLVVAEIAFDAPVEEDLPPLLNLLDPKNMALIKR